MVTREKPKGIKPEKIINRAEQVSRRDDNVKNISVGVGDIDYAIMYYFNNIIKPKVVDNGEVVKVPIIYGNAERWANVRKNGYLRDNKGKLVLPVIMFKRTSIAKNDQISVDKLDRNVVYSFEKKYSEKNKYDRFSTQYDSKAVKEQYQIAIPDYMTVSYDAVIWTEYTEQMNKIVESIIYNEGSYWGEPNKFKYKCQIDSYDDSTELSTDSDRIVKTTFGMTFQGYIIPESVNDLINTQKSFTRAKIVIKEGDTAGRAGTPVDPLEIV